jgi:hypothetical protein
LRLFVVPDPQVFSLGTITTTAFAVSNGVPGAGAGNIELPPSKDDYRFVNPTQQSVYLSFSGTCYLGIYGTLVNLDTGATVASSLWCSADKLFANLPAGNYSLSFVTSSSTGTYSFQLFAVPAPQLFDLGTLTTSPVNVSNAVPSTGAGNLETKASQDQYLFSVSSGQSVYVDGISCIGGASGYLPWNLINTSGATVASGNCVDKTVSNLAAGSYRLIVNPNYGYTGTYSLRLFVVPDPQVFSLGTITTTALTVSNGVPGAGAGNIELPPSKDDYRFVNPTQQSVYLSFTSCLTGLAGTLVNTDTGATVASNINCSNRTFTSLSAGNYSLAFTTTNLTGTYGLKLALS